VPNLEMTKLMQGANLDKKPTINSIRTTTNRNNIGIMLGQQTPSSNSLNQQYTLTAKKGKQRSNHLEVRRSSKQQNQASNTMSAVSSDNQLPF